MKKIETIMKKMAAMGSADDLIKQWDDALAKIQTQDKAAATAGKLIGRYITEPFADGHAYYQIVGETRTKVRIQVCTGIGDDWTIPYWGESAMIEKRYALQSIESRETMEKFFARKKSSK
jgi:hypothetical protein